MPNPKPSTGNTTPSATSADNTVNPTVEEEVESIDEDDEQDIDTKKTKKTADTNKIGRIFCQHHEIPVEDSSTPSNRKNIYLPENIYESFPEVIASQIPLPPDTPRKVYDEHTVLTIRNSRNQTLGLLKAAELLKTYPELGSICRDDNDTVYLCLSNKIPVNSRTVALATAAFYSKKDLEETSKKDKDGKVIPSTTILSPPQALLDRQMAAIKDSTIRIIKKQQQDKKRDMKIGGSVVGGGIFLLFTIGIATAINPAAGVLSGIAIVICLTSGSGIFIQRARQHHALQADKRTLEQEYIAEQKSAEMDNIEDTLKQTSFMHEVVREIEKRDDVNDMMLLQDSEKLIPDKSREILRKKSQCAASSKVNKTPVEIEAAHEVMTDSIKNSTNTKDSEFLHTANTTSHQTSTTQDAEDVSSELSPPVTPETPHAQHNPPVPSSDKLEDHRKLLESLIPTMPEVKKVEHSKENDSTSYQAKTTNHQSGKSNLHK